MDKRLFLLDAMALIFRAYYALIRSPRISFQRKKYKRPIWIYQYTG